MAGLPGLRTSPQCLLACLLTHPLDDPLQAGGQEKLFKKMSRTITSNLLVRTVQVLQFIRMRLL